jgi:hypothetical protein
MAFDAGNPPYMVKKIKLSHEDHEKIEDLTPIIRSAKTS